MSKIYAFDWSVVGFAALLAAGLAVWAYVRPQAEAAPEVMADDIILIGQVQEIVDETAHGLRALEGINPEMPADQIVRHRNQMAGVVDAAGRLAARLESVRARWVPVAEASLLLQDCRSAGQDALARAPSGSVTARQAAAADPLDVHPDHVGMTLESRKILEARSTRITDAWEKTRGRVIQAIVQACSTRGTFLGFDGWDLLLGSLVLTVVAGAVTALSASAMLQTPPMQSIKLQLGRLARSSPSDALKQCHEQVYELMDVADSLCRGEKIQMGSPR
jgi:hypothetical protein